MTEAIFGLVGVVIGGLLNGGVTYLTERKTQSAEVRVSARLVQTEVNANQRAVKLSLQLNTYGNIKLYCSEEAWVRHRAILATALSDEEWAEMDSFYGVVQNLILLGRASDANQELRPETLELLPFIPDQANAADTVIKRYAREG